MKKFYWLWFTFFVEFDLCFCYCFVIQTEISAKRQDKSEGGGWGVNYVKIYDIGVVDRLEA